VKYAPGTIEAHGFRGGQQVMSMKRETTGDATKVVLRAERREVAANGEDVAMFAVEVQDAQGRTVPITDNEVTFKVSGAGKLVGTGNGDPTDHAPDKGSSRKAFSGYCMGLVQATKSAGDITVEATAPGLTSASATIAAKQVELRPQIAVWEREVPKGTGITGLWRPVPAAPGGPGSDFIEMIVGGSNSIFTLRQEGSSLTGSIEGSGGFFGGEDVPVPIKDGLVNGSQVVFKSGNNTYEGKVVGDRIELERRIKLPWDVPTPPKENPNGPAIGPAPDGSDPSNDPTWKFPSSIPVVLKRVER
jgi:beta-galactosidase